MSSTPLPARDLQIAANGPLTFDIKRGTSKYTGEVHLQTNGRIDRIAYCGVLLEEQRMVARKISDEEIKKYVTCKNCITRRNAGERRTKIDETMPYDQTI